MSRHDTLPADIPVLIIGGGPVGITFALLLAEHGIKSLVVEKTDALPTTPRAHVLRKRTMDIFDRLGVADAVFAAVPDMPIRFINWVSQLNGAEIGQLDMARTSFSDGGANLPQNLLCPVLLDKILESDLAGIATHTECLSIAMEADGATAQLHSGGTTHTVRTQWVIAADGANSPTRDALGIAMEGPDDLAQFYMVHLKADLTQWVAHRPGPLFWILNPDAGGTLIVHELEKSHVFMIPHRGGDLDKADLTAHIHGSFGDGVDFEILDYGRWTMRSQIAQTYRAGRAFLVGDAAHRFPPTGGLGLNTGIMDAYNLAWKLALVEKGLADDALLNSYEMECRSVAATNAEASLHNMMTMSEVNQAIGPFKTLADLDARIAHFSDADRARLQQAIDNQASHFTSDGIYPGTWMGEPHHNIAAPGRYGAFKVLMGAPPKWARPVAALEKTHTIRIEMYPFLQATDPDGYLNGKGAVLLRPDDQVAWAGDDPAELGAALATVLAGPGADVAAVSAA